VGSVKAILVPSTKAFTSADLWLKRYFRISIDRLQSAIVIVEHPREKA
jgi:hypothetical protein